MSISPMEMDVGDDLIVGWDWISSHDLHNLFQAGQVASGLRSGLAQLQLALLPAAASPPPAALSTVIRHGELRRLIRQIVGDYHCFPNFFPIFLEKSNSYTLNPKPITSNPKP